MTGADADKRIPDLYEENAAGWDRQRGRNLVEKKWLDRLLALLPKRPAILDLGCGSGEPIAHYLIARGAEITGVDSSASLIALARKRFSAQQWHVADMRSTGLGRRFDGLIAWHSFFHLTQEDQRAMIPRFAAHLKLGGGLLFTAGPKAGEAIGEWQGEPLYHASLSPEEYRTLLEANNLEIVDHRLEDPECGSASVWLAQINPASGLLGSA